MTIGQRRFQVVETQVAVEAVDLLDLIGVQQVVRNGVVRLSVVTKQDTKVFRCGVGRYARPLSFFSRGHMVGIDTV